MTRTTPTARRSVSPGPGRPLSSGGALEQLVAAIDQGYDRRSWHGTNLRGSILRVTPEIAAWRPAPGRHNIWEIVVHAAYWRYAVYRRLAGERRGSFALKGSNWFTRPEETTPAAWRGDIALLDRMHLALRNQVTRLPPRELERTPAGSKVRNVTLISGIAAHDFYHAGQIQLLKKLAGAS